MARPRSLQPSYCHHKPSDRAFVRIGGKQIWLGKFGTQESKDKYLRAVAEWVSLGRPADVEPTTPICVTPGMTQKLASAGPTLAVVIEPYWNHAQTYYVKNGRPTDEQACIKVVLRLLNQMYGETPAKDFDSLKTLAVQQEMIRRGWARKTINGHMGRVKRALKWLASRKYIPIGVFHEAASVTGLEKGRSEAKETERKIPVPQEHIDAVLPLVPKQVRAMIELQLACAARPGEVVQLRKRDINRDGKLWMYNPAEFKTEHHDLDRTIVFGPQAQRILAPYLMRPDDAYLFSPAEATKERREARGAKRKTPLECGNRPGTVKTRNPKRRPGEKYTVDSYRRAIDRACDKADLWAKGGKIVGNDDRVIPHWHPHRLRHNAATNIRSKYGAEAAKLALGVQNLDVAEIYAERDAKVVERVMSEVG